MVEPNCPARLARFRLEQDTAAEPLTPLPCLESVERPGSCVHCFQAIERAAGAPHGPFCTGDSRCRECARLLREAERITDAPPRRDDTLDTAFIDGVRRTRDRVLAGIPAELPEALLEEWRAEADRWQRKFDGNPHIDGIGIVLCQRVASLIAALLDARRDAAGWLAGAAELEQRLDAIRAELTRLFELQNALVPAELRRRPFSATPAVIETASGEPICPARSEAIGQPLPCYPPNARCSYCARNPAS